jgi:hypothetical protein
VAPPTYLAEQHVPGQAVVPAGMGAEEPGHSYPSQNIVFATTSIIKYRYDRRALKILFLTFETDKNAGDLLTLSVHLKFSPV